MIGEFAERKGLSQLPDYVLTRGRTAVERRAPVFGKLLTQTVDSIFETHKRYSGEFVAAERPLLERAAKYEDPSKDYYSYFVGAKTHPDPTVNELTAFYNKVNPAAHVKAAKVGIPVGSSNPDNWSRTWPRGAFEGRNREEAAQYLVSKGQADSLHEAYRLLDLMSGMSKGRKSYNLRAARKVDLPGWRRDIYSQHDAMLEKLWDIAFTEVAGENGRLINKLLSAIAKVHGNAAYQLADQYVDIMFKKAGKNYRPYSALERTANSVTAARFLGLVGIRHLGQSVNAMVFGARLEPILKTLVEMMTDYNSAEEFGILTNPGIVDSLYEMRHVMEEDLSRKTLGAKVIELSGFPRVMRFNRIFMSNMGKNLAEQYVAEYAETKSPTLAKKLAQMGINADKAVENGLSQEDLFRAGSRLTEIGIPAFNPNNLPLAWRSSPVWRLLTQYKPFIYAQSAFLKDYVLKPAIKYVATGGAEGEIRPLIYASLVFPTVGEIVGDLYNLAAYGDLKNRPDFKNWLDRYVDNVSYVAGFGILHDLVYSLANYRTGLQIPLLSEGADLLDIVMSKHHAKAAARQIPIFGRMISRKMEPKTRLPGGYQKALREGYLTKHLNRLLELR
jgi:hypothetical protein